MVNSAEQVVATGSGPVRGGRVAVGNRAVSVFRGVPYARAARFESPSPVPPWTQPRAALSFGPAAPQLPDRDERVPGALIVDTDEDCLSLNVWTPAVDGAARPVLVWFHGGAFMLGASSQAVYDGARLAAEQDVVVVSANYRLGALGFLDTRALGGTATNLGMRDAIAALEWVRDHIAAFGGDVGRVTAFGESAGGGLVLHLMASPRAAGLFHGAIVQSGKADSTLTPEQSALVARTLVEKLGVDGLSELSSLPADMIVKAQPEVVNALVRDVGMLPFHPSIDDDLLSASPADAFAHGVGAVPLIAGATAEEMNLYLDPNAETPGRERVVKRITRYLSVDADHAEKMIVGYGRALGTDDVGRIWSQLFSDAEMQVGLRRALDAHAAHAPTFTYLFKWRAPVYGAFHAVDLPFTFGTFDADGWGECVGEDADARALSSKLREAWASFARDGNPGWDPIPQAMVFDRESRVERDPVAPRLSLFP